MKCKSLLYLTIVTCLYSQTQAWAESPPPSSVNVDVPAQAEVPDAKPEDTTKITPPAATFSQREGAKKSQKGFYYIVESDGEGSNITDNSTVAIRFKGTLIDGTVVDEPSVQNANQIFRVKNMMPALRDTVKLLHAGGKIQVLIPPSLVEDTVRLEHPVPVNSLLIYSMEIVDVTG